MSVQTEVFKIQQDFTHQYCLIYNEDRSFCVQRDLSKEMADFLGEDMKKYVFAQIVSDDSIEIKRELTDKELVEIYW